MPSSTRKGGEEESHAKRDDKREREREFFSDAKSHVLANLTAPVASAGVGVAAACCRTLAPSSSPSMPLLSPALEEARAE